MKRVHYTDSYLMNPQHPVTVNIIGAGGTGSQVLTGMARLDVTLRALGHPGLFVTVYDPDIVTDANIGRQLFGPSDLGLNKSHKDKQFFRKRLESGGEFLSVGIEGGKADRNCEHHHYLYG